jgi:lipopolysaccharide transport system ATP-binding protein
MSETVIRVEDLGKRYRIGAPQKPRTRGQALLQLVRAPFSYLARTLRPPHEEEILWALRNVSFEVQRGEVVGIIGRNGAGKSTLLKILSRITDPTEGRAELHGRVGSLLEVGTGFHPELTGRENIYLNGAILGMRKAEIARKFDDIVSFAEIEKFIDTPVKHYSSGMYVRLAFAVAAHLEPEILIVDEVLAVGDLQFQKKCLGKMGEAGREGRTVILVSHNMGAIRSLSHRCMLLDSGRLVHCGETAKVVNEYLQESVTVSSAEVAFPENPRSPIWIRRAALTDPQGVPKRQFTLDEQIILDMEYVVSRDVRQSMVLFAVARDGNFIFQSHDTDMRPELLDLRPAGVYRVRVPWPRRMLTAGTYTVSLTGTVGSQGQYGHDGHPDVLLLTIEECGDIGTKGYASTRGNYIITELHWEEV